MLKVCAAIIIHNNKILITQRSSKMKLPMSWEFPGGKINDNETPEECIKREIYEELNIGIKIIEKFHINYHNYDFGEICLISFLALWESGKLLLNEHEKYLWVKKDELENFDFAPADRPAVDRLIRKKSLKNTDELV
ncbi:(deoxy)nucleoside triphosphate pyrophosphohydrolase [Dethiothermospora halolimnae]|uniref:(deoxy)nucleoside triphosphate pyrophosphohydrolase n=1 Tax=Dethiothermospora halolimnae TaxID=3114390 RepID=UPI003CCBD836